ncbi:hypothetical protein EI94DRAFT_1311074 [Lactarius quietus]|nr:hypothetical protein EI94DRAFT_1311074 [Lactarius quietus]
MQGKRQAPGYRYTLRRELSSPGPHVPYLKPLVFTVMHIYPVVPESPWYYHTMHCLGRPFCPFLAFRLLFCLQLHALHHDSLSLSSEIFMSRDGCCTGYLNMHGFATRSTGSLYQYRLTNSESPLVLFYAVTFDPLRTIMMAHLIIFLGSAWHYSLSISEHRAELSPVNQKVISSV